MLLELVLESFRGDAPRGQPTDLQSLKRLVEDVFAGDVSNGFRRYCLEEPEWAEAVALLDESNRGGWDLAQILVDCRSPDAEALSNLTALSLLESAWFDDSR